jgi:hypothetical protein
MQALMENVSTGRRHARDRPVARLPVQTSNAGVALLATGLHAVSYRAVTAFIALLVSEQVGVGILRRAWFNLDAIWAGALVATGVMTVVM